MSEPGRTSRPGRRRGRGGYLYLAIAVAAAVVGLAWWGWPIMERGTPRLVVDRPEIDLGYVRFSAPARAVFILRNQGDGPLRLTEPPRVRVVAGC